MGELWESKAIYFYVLGAAMIGIALILSIRVSHVAFARRRRLPKKLTLREASDAVFPKDVTEPRDVLSKKLESFGFVAADGMVSVTESAGAPDRVLVVPYCHPGESSFFLLGVESRPRRRSEIFLHILTPFTEGRRVETSTLAALEELPPPESADIQVVLDAESIEELWSRHRRALGRFPRATRSPILPLQWRDFAEAAYDAWMQAGVRAHRLVLANDGESYKIRGRPKSHV